MNIRFLEASVENRRKLGRVCVQTSACRWALIHMGPLGPLTIFGNVPGSRWERVVQQVSEALNSGPRLAAETRARAWRSDLIKTSQAVSGQGTMHGKMVQLVGAGAYQ